ncbi:hypothetical protein BDZ94DRAFT_289328 [Collybia nuda]|uniref:CFEM domain-containing protein n=1 Tax=Collybia nuda TaxID=64659 RepID=A0A9P5XSZ4_9AGAR|nr:hypothetical protein BDZ94DRAFT_289328 [Collybia nuda]
MIQARLASNLFFATLVFTLTLSQAAYSPSLPTCVQPCLSSSATDAKCSENDFTCMCKIPLFGFTVQNCSRLYCSSKDQAIVEEGLNQLCGTGDGGDTLEPTPSSSFEIFTFGGAFTHLSTASPSSSQGTKIFSTTLTSGVSTSTSNKLGSESGKSRNITPDSENTASPQPLTSGNSTSRKYWTDNSSMLLVWLAVVTFSANIL